MNLLGPSVIASVFFSSVVGLAVYINYTPGTSPPRRLLVAVDTLSGQARGIDLLATGDLCATVSTAPAWPALYGLKATERFECRVPK
jgi:hypothetical protein